MNRDAELTYPYIRRVFKSCLRKMSENRVKILKTIFAYIFLFGIYVYLTHSSIFDLQIAAHPEIVFYYIWLIYILFVIINHSVIRFVIPHKRLFLVESLLLTTIVTILIGNMMFTDYRAARRHKPDSSPTIAVRYIPPTFNYNCIFHDCHLQRPAITTLSE